MSTSDRGPPDRNGGDAGRDRVRAGGEPLGWSIQLDHVSLTTARGRTGEPVAPNNGSGDRMKTNS